MGNKVEICGVDTSKIPVLTSEEKIELLMKMKNGDNDARNAFINGNTIEGNERSQYNNSIYNNKNNNNLNIFNQSSPPSIKSFWK